MWWHKSVRNIREPANTARSIMFPLNVKLIWSQLLEHWEKEDMFRASPLIAGERKTVFRAGAGTGMFCEHFILQVFSWNCCFPWKVAAIFLLWAKSKKTFVSPRLRIADLLLFGSEVNRRTIDRCITTFYHDLSDTSVILHYPCYLFTSFKGKKSSSEVIKFQGNLRF